MKLLAIAIAFGIGLAIGVSLCKRKPPQGSPCPETEDARWQKRIDNLDSLIAEEKANDRLRSKRP